VHDVVGEPLEQTAFGLGTATFVGLLPRRHVKSSRSVQESAIRLRTRSAMLAHTPRGLPL
jgi:hypothetical protein